jgi:hypothetical protein
MRGWDDAATWVGEGLRREVFYFGPAEEPLYGSLYSAAEPTRPFGVVICPSWGIEADRTARLSHGIALAAARIGGAGFVYSHAGHGDSHGDLHGATMDVLADSAVRAAEAARERRPQLSWFYAGIVLGGSVAFLAQRRTGLADRLLLVQPALRPSEYFEWLARSANRVTLGPGRVENMAHAYPLPQRILERGEEEDEAVRAALAEFAGEGTVVRCARPDPDPLVPATFEHVVVDASWRFGVKDCPKLEAAAGEWLRRSGFAPTAVAGSA